MSLTTILAATLLLQSAAAEPPAQEDGPSITFGVAYTAADLHADCIATVSGDPVGRRLCHRTILEQMDRLFPRDQNNAADGCLVIPMLTDSRVLGLVTAAIAQTKTPPPSSASDFAAATLLTLYPCGLRRR